MGSYDFVHLELLRFAGLHGWRVVIPFIWNFPILQGCMGGGDMIPFIWSFQVFISPEFEELLP